MLRTPKIEAYLQAAGLAGKGDKTVVRFLLYITPLTHVLAAQLEPEVAALLFKQDGAGKPHPILISNDLPLDVGTIPLQLMEMHPSPDPKMETHGVLIEAVQLSHFRAKKLYPGNDDFSLIFQAEMEKNKLSVDMMNKYYDQKVYLTFEEMQGELFTDPTKTPKCEQCNDPSVARDSTGAYLCQKDVKNGVGKIEWILKKETPKQAEKRVAAELAAKDKAGKKGKPAAEDMSHANRPRGGKTSRKGKS